MISWQLKLRFSDPGTHRQKSIHCAQEKIRGLCVCELQSLVNWNIYLKCIITSKKLRDFSTVHFKENASEERASPS